MVMVGPEPTPAVRGTGSGSSRRPIAAPASGSARERLICTAWRAAVAGSAIEGSVWLAITGVVCPPAAGRRSAVTRSRGGRCFNWFQRLVCLRSARSAWPPRPTVWHAGRGSTENWSGELVAATRGRPPAALRPPGPFEAHQSIGGCGPCCRIRQNIVSNVTIGEKGWRSCVCVLSHLQTAHGRITAKNAA